MTFMASIDFSLLWAAISQRLTTWDATWSSKIDALDQLSRVRDRQNGRTFTDEDIFEGVVKAILSGATDWSRIQALSPDGMRQLFSGFDVAQFSRLTPTDIENDFIPWFKMQGANSPYLKRNLLFLIETAAKLFERRGQHGSLEVYLSSLLVHLGGDVIALAKALSGKESAEKLRGVGIPVAAEALKNVGYDVAKPDIHITRALGAFELYVFRRWPQRNISTKAPKASDTEKVGVMRTLAECAGYLNLEVTLIDNAIWLLCAKSGAHLSNDELTQVCRDA